ncbi:MAG: hypothetical protein ACTSRU_19870 [Candidatus Hodarchaeales archaeon]
MKAKALYLTQGDAFNIWLALGKAAYKTKSKTFLDLEKKLRQHLQSYPMIDISQTNNRPEKPWTCDLCGESDDDVEMYCGGYVTFAHPKCGEIGNKAIALYLRRIAFSPSSLLFLVNEFHEIYREQYPEIYDFSTSKDNTESDKQRTPP